jgi:hypothetical protein
MHDAAKACVANVGKVSYARLPRPYAAPPVLGQAARRSSVPPVAAVRAMVGPATMR